MRVGKDPFYEEKSNTGFDCDRFDFYYRNCRGNQFFINRYTPTDEMEDLEVYYGLTEERQAALIINDEISDIPGIWRNEEVYMSYEAVWKLLDTQFYWDDSSQKMLLTTPEGIRQIAAGDTGYTTENGALF